MYKGVKPKFFESHNFRKFAGFWCEYCCIKQDKTATVPVPVSAKKLRYDTVRYR